MTHPDPALPGVDDPDPRLTERLQAALANKGQDYEPRTHHLTDGGEPQYTNRLILETSPYLLQHAHNPVNWYPWGDEAFERAEREDKPVLLSVGYSTCHWCHVMEKESFEDVEIARYINEHYIPIKVDREERPDVDDVYMKAVQMLTGSGGWPMTVMLTPSRQPFFAGTYFPARDGDRGARKGFLTILRELHAVYRDQHERVVSQARRLSEQIQRVSKPSPAGDVPGPQVMVAAARSLAEAFDAEWGGFGSAPKFPRPVVLDFLLRYHRRTGDPQARHFVLHTLHKMAAGGMYDQVGGGFHRYSTDPQWLVPHFEKMLYDNAQLVMVYLAAYQVSGQQALARVARETLDYVAREMTSEQGGFYSATDADSLTPEGHAEEGYFFTWTAQEIDGMLEPAAARLVKTYYGVTEEGNFEGRNVLHRPRSDERVAQELGLSVRALRERIEEADRKLYKARSKRPAPHCDDKVLASWNGLMISAFARGALVLGEPRYRQRAEQAADFLLSELRGDEGQLLRSFRDGEARHQGYLEDYAFSIQGLIDLYETSSEPKWLRAALALQDQLDQGFADKDAGGYFMTSGAHEALIARDKPTHDGAEPSGNSIALMDLLRLAHFTGDEDRRQRAERGFAAFSRDLSRAPTASPAMLSALDYYLDAAREVFLVSPAGQPIDAQLMERFRTTFMPNRVFTAVPAGDALQQRARLIPALEGKVPQGGRTTAYVCERGRCELPTSDPDVFARQLAEVEPLMDEPPAPLSKEKQDETFPEPEPWYYDPETDRHWHPDHHHWHDGPPPKGR